MSTPSGSGAYAPTAQMSSPFAKYTTSANANVPKTPAGSPVTPHFHSINGVGAVSALTNNNASPSAKTPASASSATKTNIPLSQQMTAAFLAKSRAESSKSSAPKPVWDAENIPDTPTDSEDAGSDWGETNNPVVIESDAESVAEMSPNRDESTPASKIAQGKKPINFPKKTCSNTATVTGTTLSKKRTRELSDGSSPLEDKAPRKRNNRTTAMMRQGPTAINDEPLDNGQMASFTSTVYILALGERGRQFHVHENKLAQSPKFVEFITKARLNRRATRQNFIVLPPHDPIAFDQLVTFLYSNVATLSPTANTPYQKFAEIHDLFAVAGAYGLKALQAKVVLLMRDSKMLTKISTSTYFDWLQDMYEDAIDHENGPLHEYFLRVGPAILRGLPRKTMLEVGEMAKNGGAFARDLFLVGALAVNEDVPVSELAAEQAMDIDTSSDSDLFLGQ